MKISLIKILGGFTLKEYQQLQTDLDTEKETNKYLDFENDTLTKANATFFDVLKSYELKFGKNLSIDNFKKYLSENIKPAIIFYKCDGINNIEVQKILSCSEITEKKYIEFIKSLLGLEIYTNADDLIYWLNLKINDWIDLKYETDLKNFGKIEKWLSPDECFKYIVEKRKGVDCEDVSIFKYTCFRIALMHQNLWEENKWRLRCIVVNVLTVGRHCALCWVKDGPNDWLPIESTIIPKEFEYIWKNNQLLRDNYLYQIDFSFDVDYAYKKI